MPEAPTDSRSPEARSRRTRGWQLWAGLALLLAVALWLLPNRLWPTGSAGDAARVGNSATQMPAPRPKVDDQTIDTLADDGAPSGPVVPDVVGLMTEDAVRALEGARYDPGVTKVYSDSEPPGVVFEQVPAGGEAAEPGTVVSVLVSNGAQSAATVGVPKLLGLKRAAAQDRIEAAGLDAKVMVQPGFEGVGTVLEQSPAPGTMVESGSKVFILVITGY